MLDLAAKRQDCGEQIKAMAVAHDWDTNIFLFLRKKETKNLFNKLISQSYPYNSKFWIKPFLKGLRVWTAPKVLSCWHCLDNGCLPAAYPPGNFAHPIVSAQTRGGISSKKKASQRKMTQKQTREPASHGVPVYNVKTGLKMTLADFDRIIRLRYDNTEQE